MLRYNDYELIYLIQSVSCEEALKLMFKKYNYMIYKYLYLYKIKQSEYDDYFQESHILMYETIVRFNEVHGKTFTRFYELVLKRRFQRLINESPKYELHENFEVYNDNYPMQTELELDGLTDFERHIFKKYYLENQNITFIAKEEGKTPKQIYNAIYRIKEKYKNNVI